MYTKADEREISEQVGRAIKQLRLTTGMKMTELAIAVGVTQGQFQKYESGADRISLPVFIKIAAALGTNAGRLLEYVQQKAPKITDIDQRALVAAGMLMRLPAPQQKVIMEILTALDKKKRGGKNAARD